ncbi:MAG TPA: NAD(P)H-binding protein [Steroidobacteraceae bacterium]|nr:NAD(P)H-binding protein [Steroidobacteraceae bacterium]
MRQLTRRAALGSMAGMAGALAMPALVAPARAAGDERIIISGASGHLGRLTITALLDRDIPARRLILVSRTPQDLAEYAKLGAATRFGDFTQPQSLPAAFAGGTQMLLISIGFSSTPRPVAHGHAIDAARSAGVKHIAYTSWIGITRGDTAGLAVDHLATEKLLKESGLAWTSLRNSIYMEETLPQAAKMLAAGSAVVPNGEIPLGYVSRANCADAAAAVLTTPGHDDRAYDITGPQLLGVREIAAAASSVTGRPIVVSAGPPGSPPARGFATPAASVVSTAVADLTGRPATSIREFFTANRAQLGA